MKPSDSSDYLPRVADQQLSAALRTSGAVLIQGPKWCGKTATGSQAAASIIYLQDPDHSAAYLQLADLKPSALLEGEVPRLIDEWQMAPQVWDAVRFAVDRRQARGQFILTGSSTPSVEPAHSGVGRIKRLVMRTMSLTESLESNRAVSLTALFDGDHDAASLSDLTVDGIVQAICRGGWPEAVRDPDDTEAIQYARNYVDALVDSDLSRVDSVNRSSLRMRALLRAYARNISTQAAGTTLRADMQEDEQTLSVNALRPYLDLLSQSFVIEDLPAWSPSLRSRTAIRTSPTRHFTDPSIAAAVLRLTPQRLLLDPETFGLLFESLCVRDLRIYSGALGGSVFHYRDQSGLEADAVIALDDGRWALVEVKLGSAQIDEAAANLRKLADRVDSRTLGEPSFLMVLTGTATAYQRDDGVLVVPLGCLSP